MNNVILFLQSIYLQTNPLSQFFERLFNPSGRGLSGDVISITPDYIPIISVFIVLVVFIIFVRYLVLGRRRPNQEQHVGIIEFIVQGQGKFEAYVNKYDSAFSTSVLRALRRNKKFTPAVDRLLELRKQKKLFFYEIFYRDVRDLLTETVKRRRKPAMIISSAPLTSDRFVWTNSDPRFSWVTLGHDYIDTCICHPSTEKFDIEMDENEYIDVWVMAPEPIAEVDMDMEQTDEWKKTTTNYMFFDDDLNLKKTSKVTFVLPYSEDLAKVAPTMLLASRQVEFIDDLNEHITSQQAELKESYKVVNKLRQTVNLLKLLVAQKNLVGTDIPLALSRPKEFITWIILAGLAVIGASEAPSFLVQLQSIPSAFLGVMALITITAVYMLTQRSGKERVRQALEDEGIELNENT